MKFRAGFVSNSSTCSFVMCGYKISTEGSYQNTIQQLLNKTPEDIIEEMRKKSHYKDVAISQEDIEEFCNDWLYEMSNTTEDGMDVQMGEGIDGIIVGVSLASISDDNGVKESEIDFDEVKEKLATIKERLNLDSPAKVYAGTYSC